MQSLRWGYECDDGVKSEVMHIGQVGFQRRVVERPFYLDGTTEDTILSKQEGIMN